jgi:mannose-1-phosphate guanylyltransferase/mannose-6-phosphate isomerase
VSEDERWSIVLAGGRGTRLASLTTVAGETIPKQYCALDGGPSMLRRALWRAAAVAGAGRVLVVVTAEQRRWWERELSDVPARNVLVQPSDRGTAAGILLPLAEVLRRAPHATVTVVPADHHVEREDELQRALLGALLVAQRGPRPVALVGVAPEEVDPGLGWIVPLGAGGGRAALAVSRFREKPTPAEAAALKAAGAVVNTFLFAARASCLWRVCDRLVPEVARPLAAACSAQLRQTYEDLPNRDFSRAVLERTPESLAVVTAAACGWSDLGTPERVARCLHRLGRRSREARPSRPDADTSAVAAALDLSLRVGAPAPAIR